MMTSKNCKSTITVTVAVVLVAAVWMPQQASAQIVTSCTTSMISSFTPCLNYLTGSSNGGSSPTADCCSALGGLLSSSSACGCLLLTGNVPLSLPINRTLAISLPRACNSKSVPLLQCKGTATPIPPSGPVALQPSLPPLPPFSTPPSPLSPPDAPPPSKVLPPAPPMPKTPPSVGTQPVNEALPPLVLPNAAVPPPITRSLALLVPVAVGAALLNRW